MNSRNLIKITLTIFAAAAIATVFACSKTATNSGNMSNTATTGGKPPTMTDVPVGNAQTPGEAFKMLFAAVKSQDPSKIKLMMSKGSIGLGEMASSQQKKPLEEVLKNGFTETTFVDNYPQMRDQRIKGNFGAIEVWNEQRKKWDDIPFILEDGSWKAAFGDAFGGKWESPGKGQAIIEQENANANNPNAVQMVKPNGNMPANFKNAKRPPLAK